MPVEPVQAVRSAPSQGAPLPAGRAPRRAPSLAAPYILTVSTAGVAVLIVAGRMGGLDLAAQPLSIAQWALAAGLAAAAAFLQRRTFTFPWRAHAIAISMDEVVVFLALLALPAPVLVLLLAPGVLLAQASLRRSLGKALFNLAVHALGAGAAALAYSLTPPIAPPLVAATLGTLAYSVATNLLVAGVYARLEGTSSARVFGERLLLPTTLQVSLGIAAGTACVALWSYHPLAPLAALPIPFLVRGYLALRALAEAESEARRRMSEATRSLSPDLAEGELAERILDACADVLAADSVTLVLEEGERRTWARTLREGRRRALRLEEPLLGADGRRIGTVRALVNPHEEPRGRRSTLLHIVAKEAASAFENLRLFQRESAARDAAERAARERAESEGRLRAILAHSPAVVFVKDLEGRLLLANARFLALVGKDEAEVLGRRDEDLFPPETAAAMARHDDVVRATRAPHEAEAVVPGPEGPRTFIAIRFPVLDADGTPVALCGIATDITERKRAQTELDEARGEVAAREKLSALGSLVSGVAHEIRTPLTYIGNHLFLLSQGLARLETTRPELRADVQQLAHHIQAALDGSDRVNRLVRGLRRYTQAHPEERAVAGLEEVVEDVIDLFRATNRGHVQLETHLQPTPGILLDRLQVQQLVLNLLTNAAEAMPHGGTVRIATRPLPGGAEVEVSDEGPGLPREVAQRMWDPFFTTKREGTGLGLSIVRRIVDAHSGTIAVHTREGAGTRFVVRFPQAGAPLAARP